MVALLTQDVCVCQQGPDWGAVAAADKRLTAVRQGGPDAAASNYLWTPNAADCAMDSEKRIENTRLGQQQPFLVIRLLIAPCACM